MNELMVDQHPVLVTIHGLTDTGRQRSENQDHFLIADLSAQNEDSLVVAGNGAALDGSRRELRLGHKGVLLIVADGMGGAAAGSIASKMAAGWIYEELAARWISAQENTPRRFMTDLRDSIEATNATVFQQAGRYAQYHGMGTTVTAVGILEGFLYLAQVGDSRAYLVRDGVATQLTRDQSLVQELIDAGTMTPEDAEASQHRNVILQAVGVAPTVSSDLTYQELRRGDTVLLCSDGLSRQVRNEEIARAVSELPTAEASTHLVALANERGGPDNITVVIARVDGPGLATPLPDDMVERRGFPLDP